MAQQFFEFGEGHLDWIEIGAVGRQEQEARAGVGDETPSRFVLVMKSISDLASKAAR
ncbi:hypothetical protein [Bradyrhizobium guangzhouense]|uniref:hypothetical protein n=1 Tax=Bradyrhizobium guangzhouense TaxID=1325095 RepID=UPI003D318E02